MAYQGLVANLPIGLQGFSGSRNPSQMSPAHLTAVEGLSLEGGVLQKEGGATTLNAASIGGTAILAGINWSPLAALYRDVIFTQDGAILKDDGSGAFATVMASGLSAARSPPAVFVPGGGETVGNARKLFMFSVLNQVQVAAADGAAMAPITSPPADWSASFPTFGIQHAGRLWGGGNSSDPHRIYASLAADHEDFTTAGVINFPVFPGESDGLVGGISFRGVLVLFKYPVGIYIIDTRDPDPANWSVAKLSSAVGAINHSAIIQIENDVMYMDGGGNIHLLSATNDFGDVNTSNISQIADLRPYIERTVSLANIRRTVGIWYAARRQAWFSMPTVASLDNDLRLMVDFNRPDMGPRFIPTRRDHSVSMWLRRDLDGISRPAAGDHLGFVWLMDREERSKDGIGYPLRFETANTDLSFVDPSLAAKAKNGQFLEVVSEPRGNWNLTIEVYWDDKLTDVLQFSMGSEGAALGAFILDTSVLTSTSVGSNRKRMAGSGRRVRFIGYNTGANQDVAVASFYLSFAVGDERTR